MNKKTFALKIAEWYREHKRQLPWRETTDPYRIWLSEIILQQTRVAQGLPYYLRFIKRFPDVIALARAPEQEVLRLWQGLGYYTRARNLYRCAKAIVSQNQGKFPDNFVDLQKLPGIGLYTAAAIASLAFHEAVAVVDGNVYRVLARVYGEDHDIASREGKDYFFRKAQSLIPADFPGVFNQAMMEFGAIHCLPRNPKCEDCIFKKQCVAFANGWQDRLPVKSKKLKARRRYFYYFVIEQNKKWGMQKREGKDIWRGLYDFYLVETLRPSNPERLREEDKFLKSQTSKIQFDKISTLYKHLLSHQRLLARFILVKIKASRVKKAPLHLKKLKFYSANEINKLPKPVLVSRYLKESLFL
jgi:A/G-specific adenine glycosylase